MIATSNQHNGRISLLLQAAALLLFLFIPLKAGAIVLSKDTVWEGTVDIREDIIVPRGVTLTVQPATVIKIQPAESTKTDPEYLSHLAEITIRGKLVINGTRQAPVIFALAEKLAGTPNDNEDREWSGLIIEQGLAIIKFCTVRDAETALLVLDGTADLSAMELTGNRYGLIGLGKKTVITLKDSRIHDNDYGLFTFDDARLDQLNTVVAQNSRKDTYTGRRRSLPTPGPSYPAAEKMISQSYRNDVLPGTTVWQGRILISGLVRLPIDARLIIMPGTIIEFTKQDTNNDGIGENGLMVQGVLLAKGTSESPIIFRSAEPDKARGDWDSINILGSDQVQNLLEFCQIQDAYRGMHFHYANVAVNHCIVTNNYRGIQFQESLIAITNSWMHNNQSGIRARDSELIFTNNRISNNQNGASFFRLDLQAENNIFANNQGDGLRIREGAAVVVQNMLLGNRFGLLVNDAEFGKFNKNLIANNLETGLALRDTGHIEVKGNTIQANGINGMVLRDSRAAITGNLISENGERGIGAISFSGLLTDNNFSDNGLYAIGLDNEQDLAAPGNWWGASDLDREIYDRADEARLGRVIYEPQREKPQRFPWPVAQIPGNITWTGAIVVPDQVRVIEGATLTVKPGTDVLFAKEAGLLVLGKILAIGTREEPINFTSLAGKSRGDWGEISLEYAAGSRFSHCSFEFATWGIHSHFVDLGVANCRFENNDGGIRFRSGPMEITDSVFRNNRIGMRAYLANGRIQGNTISNNEIGIFVREGGEHLTFRDNNITANERYAMRLGDFNRGNVDARENWWGVPDPTESIFDGRRESYIGRVEFEPVRTAPVVMEKNQNR